MLSEEEWHELKLALAKAEERIATLEREVAALKRENGSLHKELRQYKNENTPSGAIPVYLKEKLETATKEPQEKKEPAPNQRNARAPPDRAEQHFLKNCPDCGGRLNKKGRIYRRTVLHLQPAAFENVLHECQAYYCTKCRREMVPKVPGTIPNCKFDLATAVVFLSYLYVASNNSMGTIRHQFKDLMGIDISKGTISNALTRLKEYLGDEYAFLEQQVIEAKARYRDETGWRKDGRLFWNWVIATSDAVLYRIERSRCHKNAGKVKGNGGTDVSDGYGAYSRLEGEKQRCWSHLLRIARNPEHPFAITQQINNYSSLVEKLGAMFHQAKKAKRKFGVSRELRQAFDKCLLKLLQSVRWHSKNSSKLTNYVMKFDGEWFSFLEFAEVEPTNNRAERALRHIVIKRKVSQQSRGVVSTESYAMQASLFMTARQKGESYADYLWHVVEEKIHENGKF